MRKWITVSVAIVMAFSLAGCGSLEYGNTAMPSVPSSSENVTETKPVAEDGISVAAESSAETGGLASSVKDISAVLPDSEIETNVLGVYRDDIPECQEKIHNWLEEIGY